MEAGNPDTEGIGRKCEKKMKEESKIALKQTFWAMMVIIVIFSLAHLGYYLTR